MPTSVFRVGVWMFPVLLCVGLMGSGKGQNRKPSPIKVVSSVRLQPQVSGESLVEPHLSIDPGNPAHLVAAAMKLPTYGIAVFSSFDGGEHWVRHDIDQSDADPWVAITRDGVAYVAYIAPKGEGHLTNVLKSDDGGRNWARPIVVRGVNNAPQDHPVLAVDAAENKRESTIYLGLNAAASYHDERVSSIGLFKSGDDGRSFSGPAELLPNNLNNQNGSIVVLSNGNVILPFYELSIIGEAGREVPLAHPRLWVSRSEDGGQTLSRPFFVAETKIPGPPPMAAANDKRAFLTWVADHRVRLWYTVDGGRNWAESAWAEPNDMRSLAEMSAVAVSDAGTVGVAWIKRTSLSSSGACWQLLFTASLDDGKTLLPSKALPDATWCAAGRWSAGGDYFGLVAAQDDFFKLIWADKRDGYFQLQFATISLGERQR